MASMWDTFGYRGDRRTPPRQYVNCKETQPMYQGSRPIDPHFLGASVAPYVAEPFNPVRGRQVWHELQGMSRYQNNDGHISPDVRIFNLFTPHQYHRRNEYIDPTHNARMMSSADYATSIVASSIGKMNGGE